MRSRRCYLWLAMVLALAACGPAAPVTGLRVEVTNQSAASAHVQFQGPRGARQSGTLHACAQAAWTLDPGAWSIEVQSHSTSASATLDVRQPAGGVPRRYVLVRSDGSIDMDMPASMNADCPT